MPSNNNKFFNKLVSKTKVYLVIIAILLIIMCVLKPILTIPAIIIYALIMMYTYWTNQKRMAEVSEHIKDLTLNVDQVTKRTLINSPFPLIIVETDGSIVWKSTNQERFDTKAFRSEYPELYQKYVNKISFRRFSVKAV